jgi:hypothetical protein
VKGFAVHPGEATVLKGKSVRPVLAVVVFCCGLAAQAEAADIPAPLGMPVLLTSLGQSADVNTFNILARRAGVPMEYNPTAAGADVQGMQTVIISVGAAGQPHCGDGGHTVFGGSGIDLEAETARANDIFRAAEAGGAYTIVAHIGGEGRRDAASDQLLDTAIPRADAVIVYSQGNKDGYFEKAAGDRPLVVLEISLELVDLLRKLTAD